MFAEVVSVRRLPSSGAGSSASAARQEMGLTVCVVQKTLAHRHTHLAHSALPRSNQDSGQTSRLGCWWRSRARRPHFAGGSSHPAWPPPHHLHPPPVWSLQQAHTHSTSSGTARMSSDRKSVCPLALMWASEPPAGLVWCKPTPRGHVPLNPPPPLAGPPTHICVDLEGIEASAPVF